MRNIYGKSTNRLNELKEYIPFAQKEFDSLINSIASWKNSYSLKMEDKLIKDLRKLNKKWEKKARLSAGWFNDEN
tara:strand:- start:658 stop:882 length:225 start_codon:yes stop_codon:yes gene_type:complete